MNKSGTLIVTALLTLGLATASMAADTGTAAPATSSKSHKSSTSKSSKSAKSSKSHKKSTTAPAAAK